jgi:hypothetical protein
VNGQADRDLPPPPERPDCCFGGCAQCVLDDYADQMARWQEQVDAILRAREASGAPDRSNKPG